MPPPDRRTVLAGLGAAGIVGLAAGPAGAQQGRLALRARPVPFAAGGAGATAFAFDPAFLGRFRRHQDIVVDFSNDLPLAVVPHWHGLGGAPGLAALAGLPPVAARGTGRWTLPTRHAGTRLCDLRLLGDTASPPLPAAVLVVEEDGPAIADRDEVVLIEEWRLASDARPLSPGDAPGATPAIFTVNGHAATDIAIRPNERLRLRLVNGCQRAIVALKIEDHDVTVIAIDGQPAEPFAARNGELVLAPATRIDVLIDGGTRERGATSGVLLHDGTAPRPLARLVYDAPAARAPALAAPAALPSNGLPKRLDLQRAVRVELAFDGSKGASWLAPADLGASVAPAFSARRGRVVVATLVNRAGGPAVFHLHGHHARLLDRLDDGWKPFWLDTITVAAGQTQRIAFLADTEGAWLIDAMAATWTAPRLACWFRIDA